MLISWEFGPSIQLFAHINRPPVLTSKISTVNFVPAQAAASVASLSQQQQDHAKKRPHSPESPSSAHQIQLQNNQFQLLAASAASIIDNTSSTSSTTNQWIGSPLKRSRFSNQVANPAVQQLLLANQLQPFAATLQPAFHPLQFTTKQPTDHFHRQIAQQLRFNAESSAAVCYLFTIKKLNSSTIN